MFPGTQPFLERYQKAKENPHAPQIWFVTYSFNKRFLRATIFQELIAAGNTKIISSPNPFRADRSNNVAERTLDLGDNITITKSSQSKVRKRLSTRYGGIQTHSFGHSRYKKIHSCESLTLFQMTKPSEVIHYVIPPTYHPQEVIRELQSLFGRLGNQYSENFVTCTGLKNEILDLNSCLLAPSPWISYQNNFSDHIE